MAAETAMPQWIYGMSTTSWTGEELLASVCVDGRWQLNKLSLEGGIEAIDQPFDDLSGLRALNGCAVAIASRIPIRACQRNGVECQAMTAASSANGSANSVWLKRIIASRCWTVSSM